MSRLRVDTARVLVLLALLLPGPFAAAQALGTIAALPSPDSGPSAEPVLLEVAVFTAGTQDIEPAQVLAGDADASFRTTPGADVALPAGSGDRSHWLRVRIGMPATGDPVVAQTLVLHFDRLPLQRVTAYEPRADGTWQSTVDGFYVPADDVGLFPSSFAFWLPASQERTRTVYLDIVARVAVALRLGVSSEQEFHSRDRTVAGLGWATYAATLVLMLSSVALFMALRERTYLHFAGLSGAFLLMVLALDGGLYTLPGLRHWGWWNAQGIHALVLVCCVFAIGFSKHVLHGVSEATHLSRTLDHARWMWLVLAVLSLCNLASLAPAMRYVVAFAAVATAVLIATFAFHAWRGGNALARSFFGLWGCIAALIALRVVGAFAWLPPHPLLFDGFPVAMTLCLLLLSVGLADRVMEFRRQRDLSREQMQQADADLQLEQVRREFAEDLRTRLRIAAPGGELEWVAFRRMLASLKAVLPMRNAAVVAHGYHGLDLLLTEPIDVQERFAQLLRDRGGTLKGLCRSRTPMQVSLDDTGREAGATGGTVFAVVPMVLPRPAWGALLIERAADAGFESEELKRAAEFLRLAVGATDEALQQAELKRKAEIDPLTGLFNRRAGDALLAEAMTRAITERRPLSVLFVDLDHFKQINDRHGHPVGDECLRATAAAIRRDLGEHGIAARYGGEEFLVVLPAHQTEQARLAGERLRAAITQLRVETPTGPIRFSVSIGVAARQADEEVPQPMVGRADRALYAAKRNGRNQVHVASPASAFGRAARQRDDPLVL